MNLKPAQPVNVAIAWKRFYAMIRPMSEAQKTKITWYQIGSMATWPSLAYFGHYTMKMDYPEHTARHHLVDKSYAYMANPQNIDYRWGNPCTMFDYECMYNHRKETGKDTIKYEQRD